MDFEWEWKEEDKAWIPVMTTLPPAPEAIIHLVKCRWCRWRRLQKYAEDVGGDNDDEDDTNDDDDDNDDEAEYEYISASDDNFDSEFE